jgi:trans-aconitate methyltransferase
MGASGFDGVIKMYEEAFALHGPTPSAVFWPKGRQSLRFNALTRNFSAERPTVLDFGCGLAHLKPFVDARWPGCGYTGVDIVPSFIEHNEATYSDAQFRCIRSVDEIDEEFDIIVASGVFNLIYNCSEAEHARIVFETIGALFSKSRVGVSVDFMTDQVDYRQHGAYHQNPIALYNFARERLSRKVVIDQSYLPYEFCLTVFQ